MKKYLNSHVEKSQGSLPLPVARLTAQEVAEVFRFSDEDMAVLMSEGLLEPLGDPPQNGHKYFSRVVIEQLAQNPDWLDKATAVTSKYWQHKRQRQRQKAAQKAKLIQDGFGIAPLPRELATA